MQKLNTDILSSMGKDEQIAYLTSQNTALIKENDALVTDNTKLSRDVVSLKRENERINDAYNKLVEQIKIANARYFGARSDKIHPYQISLFNDMEACFEGFTPEPALKDILPKARKKKTHIDYSKFETVIIEHTLDADGRQCCACGTLMDEMGAEIKRVIKLVPAHLEVEEHRRHVYGCRSCSERNASDGQTPVQIVKAQTPKLPLEKSCASPSLLAYILYQKYALALPIYRISNDLQNSTGLSITRQTLAGWAIRSYERWLSLIYALMKERILKNDILHVDESAIQVLKEPERKPTTKSYMWLFASAACETPIYVF